MRSTLRFQENQRTKQKNLKCTCGFAKSASKNKVYHREASCNAFERIESFIQLIAVQLFSFSEAVRTSSLVLFTYVQSRKYYGTS